MDLGTKANSRTVWRMEKESLLQPMATFTRASGIRIVLTGGASTPMRMEAFSRVKCARTKRLVRDMAKAVSVGHSTCGRIRA